MKKPHYLLLVILIAYGCAKEEDSPSTPALQNSISGIWRVDSVGTVNFENNTPMISIVEVNMPHTLDFSTANLVIQTKNMSVDTSIFSRISNHYALTDLDFNSTEDTTYLEFKVPGQSMELEWITWRDTANNIEYKTVSTMYLSK